MRFFITGGSGFVGTRLSEHLLSRGHQVTVADLAPAGRVPPKEGFRYIQADTTVKGPWQEEAAAHEGFINLTGVPIFRRWTKSNKRKIIDSRILTTENLVEAMPNRAGTILFSTSAVGYYGFHGDEILTEQDGPGNDFLAGVCRQWEAAAETARGRGARVIITRFGLVMGKNGGLLGMLAPLFRWFLGGRLGDGRQWVSWIHIEDLVNAFRFIIEREDFEGAVNLCAPHPVTNRELTAALAGALHRPAFLPSPGFAVRLALGEFGAAILRGQRVHPRRLLEAGYVFQHPHITPALEGLLRR